MKNNITYPKARFDAEKHQYWLPTAEGEKLLISVTQLMRKHGLSTDYSTVDPETLKAKAARGSQIHEEIEHYLNTGDIGFATKELLDFIDMADVMGLHDTQSEFIVNNDIVAGTADIRGLNLSNQKVLADVKTTAAPDKTAWAWQLSLYERLSGESFDLFVVFHLCDNSKPIVIDRISATEIDKLLECERNGEIYQKPGLMAPAELLAAAKAAEAVLLKAETEKKAAEKTAKEYREKLYELMGQQNIKSWETLDKSMLITRIAPTTTTSIDSDRLRAELPDIAAKYTRMGGRKGYVQITLRD